MVYSMHESGIWQLKGDCAFSEVYGFPEIAVSKQPFGKANIYALEPLRNLLADFAMYFCKYKLQTAVELKESFVE